MSLYVVFPQQPHVPFFMTYSFVEVVTAIYTVLARLSRGKCNEIAACFITKNGGNILNKGNNILNDYPNRTK
jgi:hypothetical protein